MFNLFGKKNKEKTADVKKDDYTKLKDALESVDKCAECNKGIGTIFEDERIYLTAGGTEIKLCPSCHAIYTSLSIPTILKRVLSYDEIKKLMEVEEMYYGKGYVAYKLRMLASVCDTFQLVIVNEDRNLYYTERRPVDRCMIDHVSDAISTIERNDIRTPKNMTLAEYAGPRKDARNKYVEAKIDGDGAAYSARKALEIYESSEPLVDRIARIGRCL